MGQREAMCGFVGVVLGPQGRRLHRCHRPLQRMRGDVQLFEQQLGMAVGVTRENLLRAAPAM